MQERTKIEQNTINSSGNRAYVPTNEKLAEAIEMLNRQNSDLSNMAMIMENRNQNYTPQNSITPEMVQLMMMQNSMTNF
jgi:hypothetical protein